MRVFSSAKIVLGQDNIVGKSGVQGDLLLGSGSGFLPILINGTDDQTHAAHCARRPLAFLHPLGYIAARDIGDVTGVW